MTSRVCFTIKIEISSLFFFLVDNLEPKHSHTHCWPQHRFLTSSDFENHYRLFSIKVINISSVNLHFMVSSRLIAHRACKSQLIKAVFLFRNADNWREKNNVAQFLTRVQLFALKYHRSSIYTHSGDQMEQINAVHHSRCYNFLLFAQHRNLDCMRHDQEGERESNKRPYWELRTQKTH